MATDETGQLVRLPGTVDINIGSTFKMSSSFFIFVSVNNVASIQHQRWYNYPGYGLNVVGGLGTLLLMDLSAELVHLLRTHNCVAIPGFGGFVTQDRCSSMHPVEHLLIPPSKQIGFNPELKQNDGLLQNLLMHRGTSAEQASENVRNLSLNCSEQLDKHGIVQIVGLGKLLKDDKGAVQFIEETDKNLLGTSYGLEPVQLVPVIRKREKKAAVYESSLEPNRRRVPAALLAASTVLLLLATGTAFFFLNDGFRNYSMSLYHNVFPNTESASSELAFTVPRIKQTPAIHDWRSLPTLSMGTVPPSANGDYLTGYYIVVGAFSSSRNADRLRDQVASKYPAATIFKSRSGLMQVGIYGATTSQDATQLLSEVRNTIEPNAWLYELRHL